MKITENMMTSTYSRNLQRDISDLALSNLKLPSKRQYNHVSEDPVAASKAFITRDQVARSEGHISVVENTRGELDTTDSNIVTLNSILETIYEKATKTGDASSRDSMDAIVEELSGLREEILQTMSAKCGDKFLLSGSSNNEAPFTMDGDGNLLFDGKPVDAYDKNDPDTYFDKNKPVCLNIGSGTYASGTNTTKTGARISTSGVDVLGYGEDENGLPNSLYSLIDKVEEQLRGGDKEEAMDTLSQLKKKQSNIFVATPELGTRGKLLGRTEDRLETRPINLQKSQTDLESVRIEAEAINNKSCETAWVITLQLGSSIISSSMFDSMK